MAIRKRTWIIFTILLVIIIAFLYGYFQYQRTNQDLRQTAADLTVDASILIREFAGDDSLADENYRKRVLAVRGIITSIDTTNNNVSVILGDAGQNASVRFSMDGPYSEYSAMHQGMTVTIKGILNGYNKDHTGLLGDEIVFNRGVWLRTP